MVFMGNFWVLVSLCCWSWCWIWSKLGGRLPWSPPRGRRVIIFWNFINLHLTRSNWPPLVIDELWMTLSIWSFLDALAILATKLQIHGHGQSRGVTIKLIFGIFPFLHFAAADRLTAHISQAVRGDLNRNTLDPRLWWTGKFEFFRFFVDYWKNRRN